MAAQYFQLPELILQPGDYTCSLHSLTYTINTSVRYTRDYLTSIVSQVHMLITP